MKITLSSDNPNIGGIPLKETIIVLAGLNDKHNIPGNFSPLRAEELAILCYNGVDAIFSDEGIKKEYKGLLFNWIKKYNLDQGYINNFYQ